MYTVALHEWLKQQLQLVHPDDDRRPVSTVIAGLIRDGVLNGTLSPALRIPSSRVLASELGLARNTVVAVYDQLKSEGFLVAGQGSGTYICRVVSESIDTVQKSRRSQASKQADAASADPLLNLSARGRGYLNHPLHRYWQPLPFRGALMDPSLFPHALWSRLQQQHLRYLDPGNLDEGELGGLPHLKRAIADHIRTARGVHCQPEQVIITDSTTESIDLVTRLMCDPGDAVLLENPCYWAVGQIASDHGLQVFQSDVDDDGLPLPAPGQFSRPPRMVYLTPSNQFPLGNAMPVSRRRQWIDYARRHGSILLEDDYDSEYRFNGEPLPSLQGLDPSDHVFYLGTFSKTLYRGVRVAFVVVPPRFAEVFADAASDFFRDGDLLQQRVLAQFIREGHFASHLRRTRLEFADRRKTLATALQHELEEAFSAGQARISGADAGVHLTLLLPDHIDDLELADRCRAEGVVTPPLSAYCLGRRFRGLVLSYVSTPSGVIAPLVERIGPVLRATLKAQRSSESAGTYS